jgi:hypothetical protein
MKIFLFFISFLFFSVYAGAQKKVDYGVLQKPGEEVLFGFSLKKSNKIVLVCNQKNDKYLVYRFGTKDTVELQFPNTLNAASWNAFRYSGYSRGGGRRNLAMEIHSLTFKNNQVVYRIKDESEAEHNENSASIIINANGKKIKLVGRASSKNGSLGLLMDKGELIHNYYEDDTEGY